MQTYELITETKMKRVLVIFSLMLIADIAIAGTVETRKDDEVNIYNFSSSLMEATKDCSPYREDFSENNKNFFELPTKVLVDVHGKENGKCHFTVKLSNYYWPMTAHTFECHITSQEQTEILNAMKDKSTKLKHEIITYKQALGPDLDNMSSDNDILDITAGSFTVLMNKIFKTKCIMNMGVPL